MNIKIQKVATEIEKTKEKIKELQTLLLELEKQKTDLENLEIIMLVRSARIAPADFAEFIKLYQESVDILRTPKGGGFHSQLRVDAPYIHTAKAGGFTAHSVRKNDIP